MSATPIRKVLITAIGDVSNLKVVDDTLPPPPAKHAQIEVIYSGFSGADVNMRLGRYPLQKKAPLTPGYCFVGSVAALGPNTSNTLQVGDLVTALTVYDSEATRINVPEKYLVRVPSNVRDLQAATTLVLDWGTAYGLVVRTAQVSKGQKVFVHGMSGAVGSACTMLALRAGAEVYGTASARNHDGLRKLGAHPFVYTDKNWMTAMKEMGGADAVLDPLGFDSWNESFSILAKNGILVGYGGNGGNFDEKNKDRSVIGPTLRLLSRNLCPNSRTSFYYITRDDKHYIEDTQTLLQLLADGEIQPLVKGVFDLDNIQEAHKAWSKAPGMGSSVIRVGEEPKRV
jgi:synaptic vesicle membrane protein VAT-1